MAASWPLVAILFTISSLVFVSCNQPPSFVNTIDLTTVKENSPIGSVVYTLKATDPEDSKLTYGISGTEYFRVHPATGVVTVIKHIDREAIGDDIRFYVTVEDVVATGNENNVVRVPVTVLVIDENDNHPKFVGLDQLKLNASVAEDAVIGTEVTGKLVVEDVDQVGSILKLTLNTEVEYRPRNNKRPLTISVSDGTHVTDLEVMVTISDVQNRPPLFIGSSSAIIPEDAIIGTLVLKVRAIDGDVTVDSKAFDDKEVIGRRIEYEVVQAPNDWFSLETKTGELRVSGRLDKEAFPATSGVINIQVKAIELDQDGRRLDSDPMAVSVETLTITLQDVNDEAPRASRSEYRVTVPEGVPNGTPLVGLDMVVEDRDSGSNSVFNIALVDPSGHFSVEPTVASGSTSVSIRVNGPLDYENPNQRKFILVVNVTEALTKEKLSSLSTVIVTILDVNDNAPEFMQDSYSTTVAEDAAPGTIVATIRATDRDSPALTALEYSLFGNGAQLFSVNPTTGAITVADCLTPGTGNCIDFEARQSYFLSFQASDGFGQSAVVPLQIHISDSNDNVPVFARATFLATIDEGATKFEPALRVRATDPDVTSIITYSIVDGNQESMFMMDARSGEIKVNGKVRSLPEDVTLRIQASDGGKGIASASVTIRIRDSNDNNPIFERSVYTASVSETAPQGTFVEQVHATDADSGQNAAIEYRIQRGAFDEFTINPDTGVVSVSTIGRTRLDFDRRSQYEIEIVAIDKGLPPRTGSAILKVTVMNHNDKSPYFLPTTQRTQVNENADLGEKVYSLQATDPDTTAADSLFYQIVSAFAIDKHGAPIDPSSPKMAAVSAFFSIDHMKGDIIVRSRINREIASVVTLRVSVTDQSSSKVNPQIGYGSMVITIIDHNDHPPTFGAPWTRERPELTVTTLEEQPIGTILMNLLATDLDSKISHYMIDPPSPYFAIGRESGVITIKKVVDYETVVKESRMDPEPVLPLYPNQLRFRVVAYDTGVPQLSAEALVMVNVLNINDNEPIFNQTAYFASIKENSPGGAFVAQVKATDADFGRFGKISYSILSVSGNGDQEMAAKYFAITNETGVIKVAPGVIIDREKGPNKLTLQVAASDESGSFDSVNSQSYSSSERSRRMISVPIYITIEDVNDNLPSFSHSEYEATTLGHADGMTDRVPVIQISASDPDDGLNGQVSYKIKSGNLGRLTIEARDIVGTGPFADEAVVNVKVIQVNRHKPKFLFPSSPSIEFQENQKPGTKVVRVQVFDADSGHNGVVKIAFKVDGSLNVQETDQFKIDSESGIIVSKVSLDREKQSSYDLVLVATDYLGEPQVFETLQQLTIVIKDADDNRPEFPRTINFDESKMEETYQFSIYENEPRGKVIGKVTALDRDSDEDNKKIFYHLIDGNPEAIFHLDRDSGVIFANTSFDREYRSSYELVVKASPKDKLTLDHMINSQLSIRQRSFNVDDLSLALITIKILDVNDNRPEYSRPVYRSGIPERAQIGHTVLTIEAADGDLGQNSSIQYTIVQTDLYRKGYDLPDSPVRPIPTPFSYEPDGRLVAMQLMSQYPVGSRFVLHLEAKEEAAPHGVSHTKVMVWIYDPSNLIKITVKLTPEFVNSRRDDIEDILSTATQLRAIILEIRYHHDLKHGRLVREWSDLFVLVVDDRGHTDVHPVNVISRLDSNSKLHREKPMLIDKISLASAHEQLLSEELDLATILLVILSCLMGLGFISSAVACCCLKSWYQTKLIARARKAALKAKKIAAKEREAAMSIRDSTLRIGDVPRPKDSEPKSKASKADKRQQQPSRSPVDNPLWTESALKYYEEQELSLSVAPNGQLIQPETSCSSGSSGHATPPDEDPYNDGSHYATVMESGHGRARTRQRQPDNDNHEYHELVDPRILNHNGCPGDLAVNSNGEPELVTRVGSTSNFIFHNLQGPVSGITSLGGAANKLSGL
ncbi:Cadherin-87A [Halotydeus destructor]|nr:Cadherin-87A [Halotydeus destructor]